MERRTLVRGAAGGVLLMASALSVWQRRTAEGAWIESLLAPGEVIQGHAEFETRCEGCHERFKKAGQERLCLACHKEVAADLDAGQGYHGRAPDVRGKPCKLCHTEHKGRGADIVRLDRETFVHARTDFPLRGAHTRASCNACHGRGAKYREATAACVSCHRAADPHKGGLGDACDGCHREEAWTPVRFDHGQSAFPLTGKHRDVACESCHPSKRYKPTPTNCRACHAAEDKHGGRFGGRCETCHTAREWATPTFDHDKSTTYPLRGKHRQARCNECHQGKLYGERLDTRCYACHRVDDAHKGQQGQSCAECHDERGWRREVFFEHDLSRFPLVGLHAVVPCEECHLSRAFKDTSRDCMACHESADVHHRSLGARCNDCHNPNGWKLWEFDHDTRTTFKLEGAHARVACHDCHREPATEKIALPRSCAACHDADDVHRGQFGQVCERCHVTASFRMIERVW